MYTPNRVRKATILLCAVARTARISSDWHCIVFERRMWTALYSDRLGLLLPFSAAHPTPTSPPHHLPHPAPATHSHRRMQVRAHIHTKKERGTERWWWWGGGGGVAGVRGERRKHTYTHTRARAHTLTLSHTHIHTHTRMRARTHSLRTPHTPLTHTHTHTFARTHTHTQTWLRSGGQVLMSWHIPSGCREAALTQARSVPWNEGFSASSVQRHCCGACHLGAYLDRHIARPSESHNRPALCVYTACCWYWGYLSVSLSSSPPPPPNLFSQYVKSNYSPLSPVPSLSFLREVTLCGWQDVKIHSLSLSLPPPPPPSYPTPLSLSVLRWHCAVGKTLKSSLSLSLPPYSPLPHPPSLSVLRLTLCGWQDVKIQ